VAHFLATFMDASDTRAAEIGKEKERRGYKLVNV